MYEEIFSTVFLLKYDLQRSEMHGNGIYLGITLLITAKKNICSFLWVFLETG